MKLKIIDIRNNDEDHILILIHSPANSHGYFMNIMMYGIGNLSIKDVRPMVSSNELEKRAYESREESYSEVTNARGRTKQIITMIRKVDLDRNQSPRETTSISITTKKNII